MADVEMANTAKYQVVRDVALSRYSSLFQEVWEYTEDEMAAFASAGEDTPAVILAYDRVGLSIAAFERTNFFGRFNSKYDSYLKTCLQEGGFPDECAVGTGQAALAASTIFTANEWRGLQLFMGLNDNDGILEANEGAACAACHTANWTSTTDYGGLPVASANWSQDGAVPPMFTNHRYHNLGIPVNPEIEDLIGEQPVDLGLGAVVNDADEYGKFRMVTLRNIGISSPYGHNGYFKTLNEVVHFLNTRDVPLEDWPAPEYLDTMNTGDLGNLGLSDRDEEALVAFLNTLSDSSRTK